MIRPGIVALALRSTAAYVPLLLLFAALFFFLWMFLAAESLEETAAAGRFLSPEGADATALAERYSYEWRHGMAGGWPLFVPGFFAVAVATVLWSSGRTSGVLAVEGGVALLFALLAAKLLAPLGTDRLVPSFERDSGLVLAGSPLEASWGASLPGILTLVSWAALVVALQISVTRRAILPLLAPLACYSVLAVLRPGDFGDLVRPWALALGGRQRCHHLHRADSGRRGGPLAVRGRPPHSRAHRVLAPQLPPLSGGHPSAEEAGCFEVWAGPVGFTPTFAAPGFADPRRVAGMPTPAAHPSSRLLISSAHSSALSSEVSTSRS